MIYTNTTQSEYRQRGGITASAIKRGSISMQHMRMSLTEKTEPTAAMIRGTRIHGIVLEPAKFMENIAIWEGGAKRGKAWDDFEADHSGVDILKPEEFDELNTIAYLVSKNQDAASLLRGAQVELSFDWQDPVYGYAMGRADAVSGSNLIDIKTTSTAQIQQHKVQSAFYHGNDLQMGWYVNGLAQNGIKINKVYIIVIEQDPPYCVSIYEIPLHVCVSAYVQAGLIARAYRACESCGIYTGVTSGVTILEPPEWYGGNVPPSQEVDASEL